MKMRIFVISFAIVLLALLAPVASQTEQMLAQAVAVEAGTAVTTTVPSSTSTQALSQNTQFRPGRAPQSRTIYQVHKTGAIFEYTGQPCQDNRCNGWRRLDANRDTVAIAASGNRLFQLHRTGAIYEYTGQPCQGNNCNGWRRLDANPATKAIVAGDSGLYQLYRTGAIFEYTGRPCQGNRCNGWRQLDANADTVGITTAGPYLFQIHRTGAIFKYAGQPCQGNNCWIRLDLNPDTFGIAGSMLVPSSSRALMGWVDMHTHPMSHLAFGRKLFHGAPDIGSLLPADADCNHNVPARSMEQALGQDDPTHGGPDLYHNRCGDLIRNQVLHKIQDKLHARHTPDRALGAPNFPDWPKWNDVTHQKMWIDWIRRAHWGGLRVMVALAHNNKTLGDAVSGPQDGPTDDKASGDLQITEIRSMVRRHGDFMEIALTSADLRRIVEAGKLAVVLGVELDAIGNFYLKGRPPTRAAVTAELRRLYQNGVRYIFPIHLLDNQFGATAVYQNIFNLSNYREAGSFWQLKCSRLADNIAWRFSPPGFDWGIAAVSATRLGINPFLHAPSPPACPPGTGHMNARNAPNGLTPLGEFALKEMMRLGMLIDIDHMSQMSADRTLTIAEAVSGGGYPLNSGHTTVRVSGGKENQRLPLQLRRVAALGGLFGLGIENTRPVEFIQNYNRALSNIHNLGVGIGTDMNAPVIAGPPVSLPAGFYNRMFPRLRTRTKEWDYSVDGMAHYGMLADFVEAVRRSPGGAQVVDSLNRSAEYFAQMWERAERQRGNVR